jgi:hypothetical protein
MYQLSPMEMTILKQVWARDWGLSKGRKVLGDKHR